MRVGGYWINSMAKKRSCLMFKEIIKCLDCGETFEHYKRVSGKQKKYCEDCTFKRRDLSSNKKEAKYFNI